MLLYSLGTLIHLINHFDEELGGVHPDFKIIDVQKKIDLTLKDLKKICCYALGNCEKL